jgi:drug/metabolite transporter (DMT)-like permease
MFYQIQKVMLPNFKSQKVIAGLIALVGVVMFSAKSVFAKMIYAYHVDPISMLYMRMMIALPFLLIISFWFEKKNQWGKPDWKDIIQVVVISLIGYYISSILDFIGLLYVEAAIERLILFLYPTMVLILSLLFLKKEVRMNQIISIVIAYVGLIVAFADKFVLESTSLFWYGVLLIVLSSFTYAIFLTAADGLIERLGSIRFTTTAMLTMTVCIVIHALIKGKAHFVGYNLHVYAYSTIMAVFSTVIPVFMFNYAIEKLGASNVSVISCAGPVCTLMYSAILINEPITIFQVIGTFIVMGGILFVYKGKKEEVKVES